MTSVDYWPSINSDGQLSDVWRISAWPKPGSIRSRYRMRMSNAPFGLSFPACYWMPATPQRNIITAYRIPSGIVYYSFAEPANLVFEGFRNFHCWFVEPLPAPNQDALQFQPQQVWQWIDSLQEWKMWQCFFRMRYDVPLSPAWSLASSVPFPGTNIGFEPLLQITSESGSLVRTPVPDTPPPGEFPWPPTFYPWWTDQI